MINLKNTIVKRTMKKVGSIALFIGALVIFPTSLIYCHEQKCPEEFLR